MVDTLVVEAQDGDGLIVLLLGPCGGDSREGQAHDNDLRTETTERDLVMKRWTQLRACTRTI